MQHSSDRNDIVSPVGELRPYQREAIGKIEHGLQTTGKALLVLPPGSGKTVIFSSLIVSKRAKTLIVAHRRELLEQAARTLRLMCPDLNVGIVGFGEDTWGKDVTLASIQAIRTEKRSAIVDAQAFGFLVIDEGHHSYAATYQKLLERLQHVPGLAVTATPDRLDGRSIVDLFGAPVYEKTLLSMIKDNWLADLRVWLVETNASLDDVESRAGDFIAEQLGHAVDRADRNEIAVASYKKYADGRAAIAFAVNVEHGRHLAQAFNDEGIPACALSAETPLAKREEALQDHREGRLKVLVNCELLTEGVDLPWTTCIILARPTKSRTLYIQMLGRGTRLYDGKNECIVIDLTDNCERLKIQPQNYQAALDIDVPFEGLDLNGLSLLESEQEIERTRAVHAQRLDARPRIAADLKSVLYRRIDPFGADSPQIVAEDDGSFTFVAWPYTIALVPTTLESDPMKAQYHTTLFKGRGQASLCDHALPYRAARALAVKITLDIVRGNGHLYDFKKEWQHGIASEKQLAALRKWGIATSETMTKWDAGRRLDLAIARAHYASAG